MANVEQTFWVQFGADTVGFDNSVKGMNKAMASLRKEVATLNKSLRFDGANLEDLQAKFRNFQQQIKTNDELVKTLRQDLANIRQVDPSSPKVAELTNRLRAAENASRVLDKSLAATAKQIKDMGDPKSIVNLDKSIQTATKNVEILDAKLKLDPTNVGLVRQRLEQVGNITKDTADKVARLRSEQKALGQTAVGTTAWQNYEQQIIEAQLSLQKLKDGAKDIGPATTRGVTAATKAFDGLKTAATAAGTVIATGISVALTKGFSRLNTIDQAQAKMRGLGKTADEITGIMNSATKAVTGTAFGLGEAASAASQALAAGVKPGKDLDDALQGIVGSAAAAGVSMDDTARIITNVAATGKVYTAELNEMSQRGIDIWGGLQKATGKNREEISKLVSDGKIDFKTFLEAVKESTGGIAQEMGGTLTGSISKFFASLSRAGASILEGVFPQLAPTMAALTESMKGVEEWAKKAGEKLGGALAPAFTKVTEAIRNLSFDKIKQSLSSLGDAAAPVVAVFSALAVGGLGSLITKIPILSSLIPGLSTALTALTSPLGLIVAAFAALVATSPELQAVLKDIIVDSFKSLKEIFDILAPILTDVLNTAFTTLKDVLIELAPIVKDVLAVGFTVLKDVLVAIKPLLEFVATWLKDNQETVKAFLILWLGWKAITTTIDGIKKALDLMKIGIDAAKTAFETLKTVGVPALNAIEAALKKVNRSNIFLLAVTAIFDFIFWLVELYNTNEDFKKKVDDTWASIQKVIDDTVNVIKGIFQTLGDVIENVKSFFKDLWVNVSVTMLRISQWIEARVQNVKDFLGGIGKVVEDVKGFFNGLWTTVKDVFNNIKDFIKTTVDKIKEILGGIGGFIGGIFGGGAKAQVAVEHAVNTNALTGLRTDPRMLFQRPMVNNYAAPTILNVNVNANGTGATEISDAVITAIETRLVRRIVR